MTNKETEFQKGYNAGFEDYPDNSIYFTITPNDIVSDEWNRGYIQGFCKAKEMKK